MRIRRKLFSAITYIVIVGIVWSPVARAQAGSGVPSITTFLSAVNSADDEMKALAAEKSVTVNDVRVVNLAKISNPGNSGAIARAIAKNAGPIGEMREALQKNPTIVKVLATAGVEVSQVVAIDVDRGSAIHVFYQ